MKISNKALAFMLIAALPLSGCSTSGLSSHGTDGVKTGSLNNPTFTQDGDLIALPDSDNTVLKGNNATNVIAMGKQHFKEQNLKAKKTRFASQEELKEMTGLVPGSVPPFGRPILDFDLFVDPSLMENKTISFNAGSLTNSISMKLEDYMKVANPIIFDFTQE